MARSIIRTCPTIAKKIVESRPRNSIGVLKEYQRLVRLEVERHHALIESAV